MGVCWNLRLQVSNNDDAEKLIAYAKELNKEFRLEPYNEESMDGLEFYDDGFCFSEVREEKINRFHQFLDQVVAHFPDMEMEYTHIDAFGQAMFVNKNGKLKQYTPGTMHIYTEDADDYTMLVCLAEQILKEHGFVMLMANDALKTVMWEYEFDSEYSEEKCDAVIASISKAMPSTRLTCYCSCNNNVNLEFYVEKYCYAVAGDFEWVENPDFLCDLEEEQLYTISELVADPIGCYEKVLAYTRSGDYKYADDLLLVLGSDNTPAEFISKLRTEDRAWILEKAGNRFFAEGIEKIVKTGLITAEEVAQRKAQKEAELELAWERYRESGDDFDIPI